MAAESRKAIYASLAANVAIAITKFIVGSIAHSTAMLAEGVHSLVNCFDGGLLLLGQRRSRQPPDDAHPFGYGREVYFWSLIVAILFFALGAGVTIYEGVRHVMAPGPLGDPMWSYVVIAFSALIDGGSFVVGIRQFRRHMRAPGYWRAVRRSKDPALFSVVLEDVADLIGLALAFLGIFLSHYLKMPILDGIASIAIGLVLGAIATILLIETHGLLVGEAANPELIAAIHRAVLEEEGVVAASRPASLHVGPQDIVVALHVGANLIGGEWGHNPLPWPELSELPGPQCYCGRRGCIETWLSGPGMERDHRAHTGESRTTHEIVQAAESGDASAQATIARYHDRLGRGLASVVNVLDPDVIVLGGGMSNLPGLDAAAAAAMRPYVFSDTVETVVRRNVHGDSSGVRGAAWLWPED